MARIGIGLLCALALIALGCSEDAAVGGSGGMGGGTGAVGGGTGAVGGGTGATAGGTGATGGGTGATAGGTAATGGGDGDGSVSGSLPGEWASRSGGPLNQRARMGGGLNSGNVAGLGEVWNVEAPTMMTGTPAIYGGIAYFTESTGRIDAVDAATGVQIWTSQQLCSRWLVSSPLVTGDSVYIGCWGRGYALNRADGTVRWMSIIDESQPLTNITGSPKLAGNRVIFALANSQETTPDVTGGHGWIAGLAVSNGNVDWKLDTAEGGVGVSVWSSAAVDDARGVFYIGTGQSWTAPERRYADSILAVTFDGQVLWHHKFHEGDIFRAVGAAGGLDFDIGAEPNLWTLGNTEVVSAGSKGGLFKVLDRQTGQEIWQKQVGMGGSAGGVHATAAVDDESDVIYVLNNEWRAYQFTSGGHSPQDTAELIKLNGANGDVIWSQQMSAPVLGGGVLLVNDVVFSVILNGFIVANNTSNGSELWRADLGHDAATAPSFAGDMVFVAGGLVTGGLSPGSGGSRPPGGHVRAFGL